MVNLVQNAVDVMEGMAEPKLMITCRGEEEKIVVSIRDYGPGIEKGALSKVFDPFYTTKEVGKGTGLGLSISYSLARDVGGDLIAANHPGGGAVFSLILPKDIHE
jgi:two-component system sensor histidine kinase HupT/HoxJ